MRRYCLRASERMFENAVNEDCKACFPKAGKPYLILTLKMACDILKMQKSFRAFGTHITLIGDFYYGKNQYY